MAGEVKEVYSFYKNNTSKPITLQLTVNSEPFVIPPGMIVPVIDVKVPMFEAAAKSVGGVLSAKEAEAGAKGLVFLRTKEVGLEFGNKSKKYDEAADLGLPPEEKEEEEEKKKKPTYPAGRPTKPHTLRSNLQKLLEEQIIPEIGNIIDETLSPQYLKSEEQIKIPTIKNLEAPQKEEQSAAISNLEYKELSNLQKKLREAYDKLPEAQKSIYDRLTTILTEVSGRTRKPETIPETEKKLAPEASITIGQRQFINNLKKEFPDSFSEKSHLIPYEISTDIDFLRAWLGPKAIDVVKNGESDPEALELLKSKIKEALPEFLIELQRLYDERSYSGSQRIPFEQKLDTNQRAFLEFIRNKTLQPFIKKEDVAKVVVLGKEPITVNFKSIGPYTFNAGYTYTIDSDVFEEDKTEFFKAQSELEKLDKKEKSPEEQIRAAELKKKMDNSLFGLERQNQIRLSTAQQSRGKVIQVYNNTDQDIKLGGKNPVGVVKAHGYLEIPSEKYDPRYAKKEVSSASEEYKNAFELKKEIGKLMGAGILSSKNESSISDYINPRGRIPATEGDLDTLRLLSLSVIVSPEDKKKIKEIEAELLASRYGFRPLGKEEREKLKAISLESLKDPETGQFMDAEFVTGFITRGQQAFIDTLRLKYPTTTTRQDVQRFPNLKPEQAYLAQFISDAKRHRENLEHEGPKLRHNEEKSLERALKSESIPADEKERIREILDKLNKGREVYQSTSGATTLKNTGSSPIILELPPNLSSTRQFQIQDEREKLRDINERHDVEHKKIEDEIQKLEDNAEKAKKPYPEAEVKKISEQWKKRLEILNAELEKTKAERKNQFIVWPESQESLSKLDYADIYKIEANKKIIDKLEKSGTLIISSQYIEPTTSISAREKEFINSLEEKYQDVFHPPVDYEKWMAGIQNDYAKEVKRIQSAKLTPEEKEKELKKATEHRDGLITMFEMNRKYPSKHKPEKWEDYSPSRLRELKEIEQNMYPAPDKWTPHTKNEDLTDADLVGIAHPEQPPLIKKKEINKNKAPETVQKKQPSQSSTETSNKVSGFKKFTDLLKEFKRYAFSYEKAFDLTSLEQRVEELRGNSSTPELADKVSQEIQQLGKYFAAQDIIENPHVISYLIQSMSLDELDKKLVKILRSGARPTVVLTVLQELESQKTGKILPVGSLIELTTKQHERFQRDIENLITQGFLEYGNIPSSLTESNLEYDPDLGDELPEGIAPGEVSDVQQQAERKLQDRKIFKLEDII